MSIETSTALGPMASRGEWVEHRLRLAVLTGELAPGSRVLINKLAKTWSVSATPLREATHRLAADGLLEVEPHHGTRVKPLSREDMLGLYELRLTIEPLALEKSLHASGVEHRAEMAAAFRLHKAALNDPDSDALLREERHQDFHRTLLSRCRSERLLDLSKNLSLHSARYRLLAKSTRRGGDEAAHEEHALLLEACLAGDIPAASELLRQHLQHTVDGVLARSDLELRPVDAESRL